MSPSDYYLDISPEAQYFELVEALSCLLEKGDPERLVDLFFVQFVLGYSRVYLGDLCFNRDDALQALCEVGILKFEFIREDDQVDRCLRSFPRLDSPEFSEVFKELCTCLERLEGFRGLSFAHSLRILLFFASHLGESLRFFLNRLRLNFIFERDGVDITSTSSVTFPDTGFAKGNFIVLYRLALTQVDPNGLSN